jgi:Putative prokaryotic signal transducing protein
MLLANMYCPQCLTEYRDGFTEYADCQVPLAAGLPPEPPNRDVLELVTVLGTSDTFALTLARASLEDAGIDYVVACDEHGHHPMFPSAFPMGAAPICTCECRIQVTPEYENEARALLEPIERPEPISDA